MTIMGKRISNLKLNEKIRLYYFAIVIVFVLLFTTIFSTFIKYNREYNSIIHSTTVASGFSIDFKAEFDYKMYRIIIGSKPFYEEDPFEDIKAAKEIAIKLESSARTKSNKSRAEAISKFLDNLRKHVEKIEDNIKETGHYDENITILENDIRVITSLIQDTVLEYIYYETLETESVRQEMEMQMVRTIEFSIIVLCIVVIGALFFSVVISNSISKPIKQLSEITNQVAKGDLQVRSDIENGVEVKALSDSLNIMIEKTSNLIDRVKIEQTNLRKTELILLQEQINPHFLYNTLDTITWLAESKKYQEVVDMVGSLSKYFRTSLSKGSTLITLKEEEQHVRSYLEIQKVRYEDILTYEIIIDEDLSDCLVPKITLQPIVENALYHGIKNRRRVGKISIRGRRDKDNVVIEVSDNGLGMTKERVEEVVAELEKYDKEQKNFYGLFNVNERLRLHFGDAYGIHISSSYLKGTSVTVRIPYTAT